MGRRVDLAALAEFMIRRFTVTSLLGLAAVAQAQTAPPSIDWHDAKTLTLEGKGWADTAAPFDRLPAAAEKLVRKPVWDLSRHSAGMVVRFSSDSPTLHARWTLTSSRLALPHMAATGVSGLDLYAKDRAGRWRWVAVAIPDVGSKERKRTHQERLFRGLPREHRDYMLYLPLYNGVESVEIGVAHGCTLEAAPPRTMKPIVFYGTSITQGGCASRPGMTYVAMLGRRLDWPVTNLGFSGNGEMEPEVADLLAQLDPAVYVIDCLPNMVHTEIRQRVGPLVEKLRAAHAETPILLVEDRSYQDSSWLERSRARNVESRRALRREYERLIAEGVHNLHYVLGDQQLGDDGEATVDGSHPTDLGFFRQAAVFERAVGPLVRRTRK